MTKSQLILAALALLALPASLRAEDAAPVGHIKTLTGTGSVTRAGQLLPASAGMPLAVGDQLATGKEASLGVTLRDDTTVSLGPEARMSLDEFVFDPANDRLGLATELKRGTFAIFAGQIARLAPERTRITTPTAHIGIRGTKFVVSVEAEDE